MQGLLGPSLEIVLDCVCVCVWYTHVCVFLFVFISMPAFACVCTWMPEVNIKYLLLLLASSLFWDQVSHWIRNSVVHINCWPESISDHPVFDSQPWDHRHTLTHMALYGGLRNWIFVSWVIVHTDICIVQGNFCAALLVLLCYPHDSSARTVAALPTAVLDTPLRSRIFKTSSVEKDE